MSNINDQLATTRITHFYWFHNSFVDDGHLAAMGVVSASIYMVLTRYADKTHQCFPSYTRLQSDTNLGRAAIARAIKNLVRLKYIRQVEIGSSKKKATLYEILELPVLASTPNEPVRETNQFHELTSLDNELDTVISNELQLVSLANSNNTYIKKPIFNKTHEECEGKTQEKNQSPLELKNKNLSEPPENQDPPIAAAPPRDPMGDRFKSGKSLKYPVKLIGSSYEKWHTGESLLSWDESLVTVAIAQLKKHNKPCARFDAINSLNNICHQEDWAKLELLISAIAVAKPISTFVDSTQVSDRAGIDHTKIPKETMEKLRKQREELNAKWKTV